jgi:hypothetical protein
MTQTKKDVAAATRMEQRLVPRKLSQRAKTQTQSGQGKYPAKRY